MGLDVRLDALNRLREDYELSAAPVRYLHGDVREPESLARAMYGVDFVIHAAALKDVPECEADPIAAIATNVNGTQNVISAATTAGVKRVVLLSTDKAANPSNVMGATKLIAERLLCAPRGFGRDSSSICYAVRLGNVLGSAGSVIPVWRRQMDAGLPLTVTDPDMTRFVMTIEAAAEFVLSTGELATGGEVFVPRLPTLRVGDLAEVMLAQRRATNGVSQETTQLHFTGIRPGEKMHEEMITAEELSRTMASDRGFVIRPAIVASERTAPSGRDRFVGELRCIRSDEGERMNLSEIANVLRSSSASMFD